MILALTALLAALGAAETQERSRGRLRQLGNRLGTSVTPISFMRRRLDAILRERPEAMPWIGRTYGGFSEFDKENLWRPSDGLVLDWISRVAEYPDKDTEIVIEACSSAADLEPGWEEQMTEPEATEMLLDLAKGRVEEVALYNSRGADSGPATVESVPLMDGDGQVLWTLAYIQELVPGVELAFGLAKDNWILVRFGARGFAPSRTRQVVQANHQAEWEPFFAQIAQSLWGPIDEEDIRKFSRKVEWERRQRTLGWASPSVPIAYPSRQPEGWLLQFPEWMTYSQISALQISARNIAECPEAELDRGLKELARIDPQWAEHFGAFADAIWKHLAIRQGSPETGLGLLHWLRTEVQDHVRAYGDAILHAEDGGPASLENAANTLLDQAVHTIVAERDKVLEALDEDDEVVRVQWPDGGTIVELLTPEALAMEGARMHHCVGQERHGHPTALRRGETRVFSVRLPDGTPRGTLEVDRDDGLLRDSNGPYNGEISPPLLRDRLAWFYIKVLAEIAPPAPPWGTRGEQALGEDGLPMPWPGARILTGRLAGASVEAGGVDAQLVPSEEGR